MRPSSRTIATLLLAAPVCAAAASGGYLQALQKRAAQQHLASTPAWQALLHYQDNWLRPGVTSTITTAWFFRARHGRSDPVAELHATLAAFFTTTDIKARGEPARCVYPARYRFLDAHLHFDRKRMPQPDCKRYHDWLAGLNAKSVSLVFPSAFTNSPASMFGHTLLRIDPPGENKRTQLLSFAVNFAANTKQSKGLVFAYKGLTGGYPGVYGLFPYYEKVKEYTWIENRDIWDYRLAFTHAEIRQLLAHLWEMRGVQFGYYFLNKNCAYQLLALLDAARPGMHLTDRFSWYAIPADTIRALRTVPGLLGPAHFRPALATVLAHNAATLTPAQRRLALKLAHGRLAPDADSLRALAPRTRARVLEVASDDLYYRSQTDSDKHAGDPARARAILLARSRIPVAADFTPVPVPATPPDAGHDTRRATLGGVVEHGDFSLALRLRVAYHDLLDPPGGYTPGARIEFFDLALRLDPNHGPRVKLDSFTLLDIMSISPRSRLFKPLSWQIATGLRRRPVTADFDRHSDLGYYVQGGPGLAWGKLGGVTGYGFALASADANHGFDRGFAIGGGVSAGLLAHPLRVWRIRAELGGLDYAAGDHGYRAWARLGQQWDLAPDVGLRLTVGREDTARRDFWRGILSLQTYF